MVVECGCSNRSFFEVLLGIRDFRDSRPRSFVQRQPASTARKYKYTCICGIRAMEVENVNDVREKALRGFGKGWNEAARPVRVIRTLGTKTPTATTRSGNLRKPIFSHVHTSALNRENVESLVLRHDALAGRRR